jgi:folate-binding protein YgfZ
MNAPRDDYDRLRRDAGYVTLAGWTCLGATGADRATFLNNLCTNNVVRLRPGQGCEAFFTDVKGHILAHVLLLCRPAEILVWTVPDQAAVLLQHLEKYLIREDVTLVDHSSSVELFVLAGEKRWNSLRRDYSEELSGPLDNLDAAIGQVDAILTRCDWFGPHAVVIQCPAESAPSVYAALEQRGAFACDPEALEVVRIESGTPFFGIDFDTRNLPQEVNRNEAAISFTKGCYLGQETVARIDAVGHVNRLLVPVRFDGSGLPHRGTPLLAAGKEVGQVTSAVWSPLRESPLGLALVRRGFHEAGTALDSAVGAAWVE